MAKHKVAVFGTVNKVIFVNPDATFGATLGVNVFLPDGSVGTPATIATYLGLSSQASSRPTYHRLLAGLADGNDHPQYPLKASPETISGDWTITGNWTFNADDLTIILTDDLSIAADTMTVTLATDLAVTAVDLTINLADDLSIAADTMTVTLATDLVITADNVTISGGPLKLLQDDQELQIGAGQDLKIFHNGTNSVIRNNTGLLQFLIGAVAQLELDGDYLTGKTQFRLDGIISPSQLTANTDNWSPTNLATAFAIRAYTDASRNLTGIAGGASGRFLLLMNIGTFDLVLKHDATSTTGNRFYLFSNADVTLPGGCAVLLWYDSTSTRWRQATGVGSGTGGGGGYPPVLGYAGL